MFIVSSDLPPTGVVTRFRVVSVVCASHKRDVRVDAAMALELDCEDILSDLVVKQEVAQQFKLTPVPVPVDPPAKRAKKMKEEVSLNETTVATGDVKMDRESSPESGSDSSDSNSDFSSEDGSSDVSDLDKFEEAYAEFGKLTAGVDPKSLDRHLAGHTSDDVAGLPLAGGFTTLQSLANVPKTWLLARLPVPLSGFSKHLERPLEGFCLEVYATNADPDEQLGSIKAFAKDLVLVLAFHLAERIATLLRQVLDHPTKVLYDPENEVLFLPQFWLFPIYRELLNTASRNRPSKDSEVRRAASGLVKVLCTANDSTSGGKGSRKGKPLKQGGALARFNEWFGSMSLMNTLYVWFPASWEGTKESGQVKKQKKDKHVDGCTATSRSSGFFLDSLLDSYVDQDAESDASKLAPTPVKKKEKKDKKNAKRESDDDDDDGASSFLDSVSRSMCVFVPS